METKINKNRISQIISHIQLVRYNTIGNVALKAQLMEDENYLMSLIDEDNKTHRD